MGAIRYYVLLMRHILSAIFFMNAREPLIIENESNQINSFSKNSDYYCVLFLLFPKQLIAGKYRYFIHQLCN